jgi:DNA-binding NtrC family response regulator
MTPDPFAPALDAGLPDLLGASPAMRELLALVRRVAPHASTVLVTGETGNGKELVARALHRLGPRAGRAFVPVNCAARRLGISRRALYRRIEKFALAGVAEAA